ncbi:MAG: hypothetical protein ACI4RO_05450, partial [Candidatus Scatosoma sp.]
DVQVDFAGSETTVVRGGNYTFKATVTGTGAFDNSVTWSVTGGLAGTSISSDGVLTVAANETASTLTVKAVANGDNAKFATKTLEIYSKVTIRQGTGSEDYYKKAGETVSLTAIAAPSGYHFTGWTKTGEGTFADKNATETDFTVSTSNVTIQSNFELHSATSGTWQSDGTRHWHVCSCGAEVDVAPHVPDRTEATETEPVKCSVCGYIITPALGHVTHTPGEEWISDDTNHWHNCTGCSEKLDEAPHTFGEWSVTVQPQVGVVGEKERECSVCGYKETAPVEALGGEQPGGEQPGEQPGGEEPEVEQPEETGLSGGAIAGIAVGSVAVAGVGGFSIFWFVIKKKKFADLIAIFKKK